MTLRSFCQEGGFQGKIEEELNECQNFLQLNRKMYFQYDLFSSL